MRIAKSLCCAVAAAMLLSVSAGAALAQDDAGIRKRVSSLRDAVNSANAAAASQLWTADGTYLDEDGNRFAGRDAVQKNVCRRVCIGQEAER